MKKIIILLPIMIIFLTGCEVKYNINIASKQNIQETIKINVDDSLLENSPYDYKEYIEDYEQQIKESNIIQTDMSLYKKTYKETDSGVIVTYNRKYTSLDEYINNVPYQLLFANNKSDINNNIIHFDNPKGDGINYGGIGTYKAMLSTSLKIEDCDATNVDKNKGIYRWDFGETPTSVKFTLTDKENVKKRVTKTVEEHGDKGGSLVFILIFAIIIIILSLVFIIYNVGRNKNKI